ncbi:hypothetical protein LBMAG49_06080 [Planctomycetota bacterium]|nr:hypothetical protein LBMAG49_06080 [Planctomycetota bacterium]
MNRTRVWILACAVGCFAAGMSVGLAFPSVVAACSTAVDTSGSDESFVRRFTADYGLGSNQQRQLRAVLQRRAESEREVFRAASDLPAAVAAGLEAVRRRASERVRALLNDQQRADYDRAVLPEGK